MSSSSSSSFLPLSSSNLRKTNDKSIILHIDLDCFYAAVEIARDESLRGLPTAVAQYNPFGNLTTITKTMNRRNLDNTGAMIAVNYEARSKGVKRSMSRKEALEACPELQIVQVPVRHSKADLEIYRTAGENVVKVLKETLGKRLGNMIKIEKASVDEMYLDVTQVCLERLNEEYLKLQKKQNIHEINEEKWSTIEMNTEDNVETVIDNAIRKDGDWISQGVSFVAGEDVSDASVKANRRDIRSGVPSKFNEQKQNIQENKQEKDLYVQEYPPSLWFSRSRHHWTREELLLAQGCCICHILRQAVKDQLGYTCSGGVSNNKTLAKLASAMNKPAKQTVIVPSVIPQMMNSLPITRLKGFGGKLGKELIEFYCSELSLLGNFYEMTDVTVGEFLSRMSEGSLNRRFGDEKARHILNMCRGEGDDILVDDRHLSKSVICGKTFRGTHMHTFANLEKGLVMKWFEELASELVERVEREEREHERLPRIVTVSSNLRVFPTVMSVNQAAEEKNYRTATKFDVSKQDKWIPGSDAVRVAAQCESMMKKAIKASMGLRIPTQQTGRVMLSTIYVGAADFYDLNTSSMNKLSGYFPSVSKIEKMDEKENQKSQIIVEDNESNHNRNDHNNSNGDDNNETATVNVAGEKRKRAIPGDDNNDSDSVGSNGTVLDVDTEIEVKENSDSVSVQSKPDSEYSSTFVSSNTATTSKSVFKSSSPSSSSLITKSKTAPIASAAAGYSTMPSKPSLSVADRTKIILQQNRGMTKYFSYFGTGKTGKKSSKSKRK